ncbi:MAG: DUF1573 domain-containing protein [Pirellulales bacterium]|nr:DUF1573 domain-containing protein [Pirellulales bacterium]
MIARFFCGALGCWLLVSSPATAQQWAKDMFKTTDHDFGVVARGAKAEFAFKFENLYIEDVHVQGVQSTCGCADIKHPTKNLVTYAEGEIVVTVDTRSFLGTKESTITVIFDKPFPAKVPLTIHSYIRSDVVFQPGSIQFGSVPQGKSLRRKTTVNYAGRSDWAITDVKSPCPYLTTERVEVSRSQGRVTYDLWVILGADAPPGYLNEHLILETNDTDKKKSKVPLAVEGIIVSALSVRPTALTFLAAAGGEPLKRNLVLQGQEPFKVLSVSCPDVRIACTLPQTAKRLHVIPVTFTPGTTPGKLNSVLQITTDPDFKSQLKVDIHAEVVAEGTNGASPPPGPGGV